MMARILLRSEDTGGRLGLVEVTVPAGWAGPPLHHHDFDEGFCVLAGELTFQLGDERAVGRPGAAAFAPRGVVHTLANHGDTEARYLLVITPGGFERRFDASGPVPETIVVGGPLAPGAPASLLPVAAPGINVVIRSDDAMSVMDNVMGSDVTGPPLHRHAFDEAFYIVDGSLTFRLGSELVDVGAGEVAHARGGVAHTFTNRTGAPARFLLVCAPAGFERHFARVAARNAGAEPPAWALAPLPDVEVVGPPLPV